MAQQPRFSRRFLTILIAVTSIAIALLTRFQPPEQTADEETPSPAIEKAATEPSPQIQPEDAQP